MDTKQFDELVARLANASSRRDAVKGVVGGALASVGVTSVASAKKDKRKGPKNGKGKGKGSKNGKGKGPKNGNGNGNGNDKGKGQEKVTICHKGQTIAVAEPAVQAHLKHGDAMGPCYGD
jgi:hypothetical protein